jgi:hypothetical protein
MANTTLTAAALFGTYSTLSPRTLSKPRVGFQEFSFSGIDGVFGTALGQHGTEIVWSGIFRTDPTLTTQALAGSALNALVEVVNGYWREGTVLDLFASDSTNLEALYVGSASDGSPTYTNVTIREFSERGKRGFTYPASGKVQASVEFDITFLKLF